MENYVIKRTPTMWRWDGEKGNYITLMIKKTEGVHLLNPTAAYIYRLLDGKYTIREIVNLMMQKYNSDHKTISQDVLNFVTALLELGAAEIIRQ